MVRNKGPSSASTLLGEQGTQRRQVINYLCYRGSAVALCGGGYKVIICEIKDNCKVDIMVGTK